MYLRIMMESIVKVPDYTMVLKDADSPASLIIGETEVAIDGPRFADFTSEDQVVEGKVVESVDILPMSEERVEEVGIELRAFSIKIERAKKGDRI